MGTAVRRARVEDSSWRGRRTLEQRFEFRGADVDADAIADVLLTAPLIGESSIFGRRPGQEASGTNQSRMLYSFSPAPGFRFDVDLSFHNGEFVVRFSQPDLDVPYLQGDLLWILTDDADCTLFDEQINTDQALGRVSEPLGGSRPSLRRWLFFKVGHKKVMQGATRNIATLLDQRRAMPR